MTWIRIGSIALLSFVSLLAQRSSSEALIEATQSPNVEDRRVAVSHLSSLSPTPQVLAILATALNDPESQVRGAALSAIEDFRSDATELASVVVELLSDVSPEVRASAARALGRIGAGGNTAVAGFRLLVGDQNRDVRFWVAVALSRIGGDVDARVELLNILVHDAEPSVRSPALRSLSRLLAPADGVELLIVALSDEHSDVRQAAAIALGELGRDALSAAPHLVRAIDDIDWGVKAQSMGALVRIGPEQALSALPKLGALVADDNAVLLARSAAMRLLSAMGDPARIAAPQLKQVLDANHPALREMAQDTLLALGIDVRNRTPSTSRLIMSNTRSSATARAPEPGEIDRLIRDLAGPDIDQQERAAEALGSIGVQAEKSVPALARALRGESDVRNSAARALVSIGRPSVLALVEATRNPDREIRVIAVRSLGQIGDRADAAAANAVAEASRSDVIEVRVEAVEALGRLHGNPEVVVPALISALAQSRLQVAAIKALAQQKEEAVAAAPALIALLDGASATEMREILRALTNIKAKMTSVVPRLALLLNNPDDDVRTGALLALNAAGPAAASVRPAIAQALDDPVSINRSYAIWTLARTYSLEERDVDDHSAAAIVPQIVEMLDDEAWMVRHAALETLGRIGRDALSSWSPVEVALGDPHRVIRYRAADVLVQLAQSAGETQRAVVPLILALGDRDDEVRIHVAEGLGKVGSAASSAIPELTKLL